MVAQPHGPRGLAHGIVGPAPVIAFGTSIVAPAASVPTLLVILASYAGFASPLVVVITFLASLCCAISIAELARRMPAAGWAYTSNSRGLGPTAGFLTGWMMIFSYALFVPAGVALTSVHASQLADDVLQVTIQPWAVYLVALAAVALVAYLGIALSSSLDLALVAGEMAVIAALAVTILIKIDPKQYSLAVFSPASLPHGHFTDITNAMIFGITAFAGFEAAAAWRGWVKAGQGWSASAARVPASSPSTSSSSSSSLSSSSPQSIRGTSLRSRLCGALLVLK